MANELQDDDLNFYPHITMPPTQGQLEARMMGSTYEPGLPNNTDEVVSAVVNMIVSVVLRKKAYWPQDAFSSNLIPTALPEE